MGSRTEKAQIKQALLEKGYYHRKDRFTLEDCYALARSFGRIVDETDVLVRKEPAAYLETQSSMPFHTDGPEASLICWYCIKQDKARITPTLLIDLGDLRERFKPEELALLKKIRIIVPATGIRVPMIRAKGKGRIQICFAPWQVVKPLPPAVKPVYARFLRYVRSKSRSRTIAVPLKAGECFFIDNHRVLHARPRIVRGSKRHLRRLWISVR